MTKELKLIERLIARATRQSVFMSRTRVATVVLGLLLGVIAYRTASTTATWLVIGALVVLFVILVRIHERVEARRERLHRWRQIKLWHRARLSLDWARLPEPPVHLPATDHPFSADLNLLGPRSVHHLLFTGATAGGSLQLADWLTETGVDLQASKKRQQVVRELSTFSLFRDRLILCGMASAGRKPFWEDAELRNWLDREYPGDRQDAWLFGLGSLAVLTIGLIAWDASGGPPLWPFTLSVYSFLYVLRRKNMAPWLDESYRLAGMLAEVEGPLHQLERARIGRRPALAAMLESVRGANAPGPRLRRARRIAAGASFSSSELLRLILNLVFPWDLLFIRLLDRLKVDLRDHLPAWLKTWYELEALGSLANWAAGRPDCAFPDLYESASEPGVVARDMGHPLIRPGSKVRNDLDLGHEILLITGSNMSGKSTFLRTLGVNVRLAYAGGAVDATVFRVSGVRLFTCMNVTDSVQDGLSFFYAEVRRLKALLDAAQAGDPPVLFLIDEIFRGTNNRERLIGSKAYVHALAITPAGGLVATHDLELTRLDEDVQNLRNAHFREDIRDGEMVFDYLLHAGPCPTTNALKIMRLAGLPG